MDHGQGFFVFIGKRIYPSSSPPPARPLKLNWWPYLGVVFATLLGRLIWTNGSMKNDRKMQICTTFITLFGSNGLMVLPIGRLLEEYRRRPGTATLSTK